MRAKSIHKGRPVASEADELKACLETLALNDRVVWFARMNTGVFEVDGRKIRAGFKGCPDIIGQLDGGRFLAFEVKKRGAKPTKDQAAFLAHAEEGGATVGWGRVEELRALLHRVRTGGS